VGVLVLAGGGSDVSPAGIGLAVVAGAAYATYTLAAKRLLARGHPPERVMAGAFGAGAILLVPVLAIGDPGPLVAAGGFALVLFLGVVPTALAYVLFARGLRHLSAAETSTLTLAEPLTAGVLGAVVLAEPLSGGALAGAGFVLGGLLLLALPGPSPRVAPAAA
jgi:DME family drug/metabolite transporter